MSNRTATELELLRARYPDLEYREADGWVRIPVYRLPEGVWNVESCEVAFRFPELPGQPPYGFLVRPGLELKEGGQPNNYTPGVETPFGPGWGQFSWTPDEWRPASTVQLGSNMFTWVESFGNRLREGA